MKVLFMGTGDIAIPSFLALVQSEFDLVALVTQPDKPVGRKQIITPPKLKELAQASQIPVLQPERVRKAGVLAELEAFDADVFVVMAYGQILPKALLDLPKVACVNLHASLLPRHRGASCIQAAIAQGDSETGVTVMHMSEGLDEGDVILMYTLPIGKEETGGQLHDRLAAMGPHILLESLQQFKDGSAQRFPQDDTLANYAPKLLRNDGEIDWKMPAVELERLIRAYEPWPGTFTWYTDAKGKRKRLKIFAGGEVVAHEAAAGEVVVSEAGLLVACGAGSLRLAEVQAEGGRRMPVADFMHSGALASGSFLGA